MAAMAGLPRHSAPGVVWEPPDLAHVTLRFLGPCDLDIAMTALANLRSPSATAVLGPEVAMLGPSVVCVPVAGVDGLAADSVFLKEMAGNLNVGGIVATGVEDGVVLSLDHLRPNSAGGSNAVTNLVTCCHRCNSARGSRPVRTFCRAVAEYLDVDAASIERHVRACARRALPRAEALELLSRRGSVAAAIR
jgi:hypothetical protein